MRDAFKTEDWWAVWIGMILFGLALVSAAGGDALGWGVSVREWTDVSTAIRPIGAAYSGLPGWASLLLTYVFLLVLLTVGAWRMGWQVGRFMAGFSVVFWVSFGCLLLGNNAYIAATPDKRESLKIAWSIGLTGEAGYILALAAGLIVGNFFPGVAGWLREGARSEWFIKTAVVILGGALGFKAAGAAHLTSAIMFRGFAAIVEAYLVYWALVYFIARYFFRFSREWAAPLASGISICGVSAAIATGAAIRARPVVAVMVSSLVVVFAVLELLLLPFLAGTFLYLDPLVAAAWMGLAVKTDGAAVAAGAITDAWVRTEAQRVLGITYEPGWMLMTTTTVKMFIDVFIGVWAFLLALIWVYRIDRRPGEVVRAGEIWQRFPKFVLGYALAFVIMFTLSMSLLPKDLSQAALKTSVPYKALELVTKECDAFRSLFFAMTFFAIGVAAHFKKLWGEGLGRLALVYVVCLFGFIIWIGLGISWIFFHGVQPPTTGG
jgi:uncharacterized membrane protein YadS